MYVIEKHIKDVCLFVFSRSNWLSDLDVDDIGSGTITDQTF